MHFIDTIYFEFHMVQTIIINRLAFVTKSVLSLRSEWNLYIILNKNNNKR